MQLIYSNTNVFEKCTMLLPLQILREIHVAGIVVRKVL